MNPWKTLSSKIIIKNEWFRVHKDKVITPTGKTGEYTYLENRPFSIVAGVHGGKFVLVKQYRYTIQREMLEFSCGGANEGEDLLKTAKREFQEETGYLAKKWTDLGVFYSATSTNKALGRIFLAEELTKTTKNKMAEDGITDVMLLSPKELERQIADNTINDSKTITAYFKAKLYLAAR